MFIFGDAGQTVELLEDEFFAEHPGLKDLEEETASERDLTMRLVCIRMALQKARREGVSEDIVDMLLDRHDKAFLALCRRSEEYRDFVATGKFRHPREATSDNRKYYQTLSES